DGLVSAASGQPSPIRRIRDGIARLGVPAQDQWPSAARKIPNSDRAVPACADQLPTAGPERQAADWPRAMPQVLPDFPEFLGKHPHGAAGRGVEDDDLTRTVRRRKSLPVW